jgi:hypothetical protein
LPEARAGLEGTKKCSASAVSPGRRGVKARAYAPHRPQARGVAGPPAVRGRYSQADRRGPPGAHTEVVFEQAPHLPHPRFRLLYRIRQRSRFAQGRSRFYCAPSHGSQPRARQDETGSATTLRRLDLRQQAAHSDAAQFAHTMSTTVVHPFPVIAPSEFTQNEKRALSEECQVEERCPLLARIDTILRATVALWRPGDEKVACLLARAAYLPSSPHRKRKLALISLSSSFCRGGFTLHPGIATIAHIL